MGFRAFREFVRDTPPKFNNVLPNRKFVGDTPIRDVHRLEKIYNKIMSSADEGKKTTVTKGLNRSDVILIRDTVAKNRDVVVLDKIQSSDTEYNTTWMYRNGMFIVFRVAERVGGESLIQVIKIDTDKLRLLLNGMDIVGDLLF